VTDKTTGGQYRFVMPGPSWQEEDMPRALNTVDQATGEGTLVVLSGSQPPGVAKEFPSLLAGHIAGRHARIIVDTSGPALFDLAEKPREAIHTLRMNDDECEELAGEPHPAPIDSAKFAEGLIARGVARHVIVARGKDGSVLSTGEGSWHAAGADVPVVSKVGAGDSFVGAYTLGLAREWPIENCLRFGVAAASAAVTTEATRLCDRETTERLMEECRVTRL
jgi:6-phosphofructokinase 2